MTVVDVDLVRRHLTMERDGDNARLQLVLDAAMEIVTNIVGPLSGSGSGRVTSDGTVLVLPTIPVTGVTSVTDVLDTTAPLDPTSYTVDLVNGFIYGVPAGTYNVVYAAGWTLDSGGPDLPADMASGVIELVRRLWVSYKGGKMTSGASGGDSQQLVYSWAVDRFARYRTVKVV